MLKRTITGLMILVVLSGIVLLRYVTTMVFDFFVLLLSIVAVFEMVKAIHNGKTKPIAYNFIAIAYPSVLFSIYLLSNTLLQIFLFQLIALLLLFIICMCLELFELAELKKENKTTDNTDLLSKTKNTFAIILYPSTLLGFLYGINAFGLNIGLIGLIIIFAVTMLTDVFAYFFGTLFKGKGARLCPQISPNKGVIGMIFGAIGGVLASAICFLLFYHFGFIGNVFEFLSLTRAIIMFVTIGIVGTFLTQFGDLLSSALKRKNKIKDFGNLFPGHGGVMDRVDGLMFCSALVFVLFALIF